ncbi:hypothetical protein, partial [Enterobacter intestinihominis]
PPTGGFFVAEKLGPGPDSPQPPVNPSHTYMLNPNPTRAWASTGLFNMPVSFKNKTNHKKPKILSFSVFRVK